MNSTRDQIKNLLDNYPVNAKAHRWYKPSKSSAPRPIAIPNIELKLWLRKMNKLLRLSYSNWPGFMHGGIKGRSYVSYARPHVGESCVITVDVKSCFNSISENDVLAALQRHLHLDSETSKQLANRLCFKNKIAQGFPTSNFICNLYLLDPLTRLDSFFTKNKLNFGNYIDDIAVSGNIINTAEVINKIARQLSSVHLKMNKAKVTVMPSNKQQVVCGLLVNKRLTLTRKLKTKILSDIAGGQVGFAGIDGWVSNLKSIDQKFGKKIKNFALKKGLYK